MEPRRIAFVPPRYGPDVVGGAELVLRQIASGLADRGWTADVLTTCARDHHHWANEYPAGVTQDGPLTIHRFPVVNDTPGEDRARVEHLLAQGEMPTLADQERWMNDGLRVPELFHHVLDHAGDYRAIVVSPYPFWTTFAVGQIAPERTILRPCLHDEPYARMELFEPLFSGVAGLWLQTEPELELLTSRFPSAGPVTVAGEGVPVPGRYDAARFRARHGLGDRTFVLYGGRREGAKGWQGLLDGFAEAVRKEDLDLYLVTFGVGEVRPPVDVADRVIDLGFVSDEDRDDAMAAAAAYVQPSTLESFSRMVMEAWLAGTPVIANRAGAVVRWHIERSDAGLLYEDDAELEQCLRFVAEAPDAAGAMAKPGRDYVLDNYTWPVTLDRMEASLEEWLPEDASSRVLVVAPYPPLRDGIGAYALQQVRKLRAAGHTVEACSPAPSAAHHHLPLAGPKGAAALGKLMRDFDRTIVHFHPDVFYKAPSTPGSRTTEGIALGTAFRAGGPVDVRVHELDDRWGDPKDPSSVATRWMLRGAAEVQVHTAEQRDQLLVRFGLPPERVVLVDHGADFVAHTSADRRSARTSLDLPEDQHVFLCIGFVQAHKGFDRAVRAFAGLAERGARLDVVGSARVDDQQTADHVDELRRLAREIPGVHLHFEFVSDEAFDRWIVAADTVVLPYRHIWSSSVAERAALLGRPVIATRVGGLADQVGAMPGAVLVDDNAELAAAMARALGGADAATAAPSRPAGWPVEGGVDRAAIQDAVEARAAVVRGGPSAARSGSPGERRRYAAPSAPLRRLRPLTPPAPVSARPGVSLVKRLVRRVMAWEVDPLADQLNALQRATTEAIDAQTDLLADRDT